MKFPLYKLLIYAEHSFLEKIYICIRNLHICRFEDALMPNAKKLAQASLDRWMLTKQLKFLEADGESYQNKHRKGERTKRVCVT